MPEADRAGYDEQISRNRLPGMSPTFGEPLWKQTILLGWFV